MDSLNRSGQIVEGGSEQINLISLLKNPQKFKEMFYQLTSVSSTAIQSQEYEKALKSLNKCLDMMDIGKNILKDVSGFWKLCIYGNLACSYQGTWKMQKCNKFCEKLEEELQKLIESSQRKEEFLNFSKHLIRIKFQHCAILSQLNQHDRALVLCQSTLPTLEKYIAAILEHIRSLQPQSQAQKPTETVSFRTQVLNFAQEILNKLLNCLQEPLKLTVDKSSFYYWQRNPQNNEKQVEKRFVSPNNSNGCKRSILGVNKMAHWIDEFNIGTIMHMSELTIKDFERVLPINEYLFKDKLYEIVIHCSIAHFSIATEMRFIESGKQREALNNSASTKEIEKVQASNSGQNDQEKQKREKSLNIETSSEEKQKQDKLFHSNISLINKKYGHSQKSEMFQHSELYHLRAINIMAQNIKATVPYLSHLIKSYDKHYIYKKELDPVMAIPEESFMSVDGLVASKKDGANQSGWSKCKDIEQSDYFVPNNGKNGAQNSTHRQIPKKDGIHENMHILDHLDDDKPLQTDGQTKHRNKTISYKKLSKIFKKSSRSKMDPKQIVKNLKKQQKVPKNDEEHSEEEIALMMPTYATHSLSKNKLHKVKSADRLKTALAKQTQRTTTKQATNQRKGGFKKDKDGKDGKDGKEKVQGKKQQNNDQQIRINHQSCTQIKVVYNRKKK